MYPRKKDVRNGTNIKGSFLIIVGSRYASCTSLFIIAMVTDILLTLNKANCHMDLSAERKICGRIK
jgi:hypothetical protein